MAPREDVLPKLFLELTGDFIGLNAVERFLFEPIRPLRADDGHPVPFMKDFFKEIIQGLIELRHGIMEFENKQKIPEGFGIEFDLWSGLGLGIGICFFALRDIPS